MKKSAVVVLVYMFLLLGCQFNTSQNDSVQKTTPSAQAKTEPKQATAQTNTSANAVVSCEDSDGFNPETKGTVKLTYGNGQHENLDDYCAEKNQELFTRFVVEYVCDGLQPKTRLGACSGNETCSKGGCV